ncbi:MAG: hypothetical protein NXI24_24545 [bacterium]|nr:hypothetical protein [bacterium]
MSTENSQNRSIPSERAEAEFQILSPEEKVVFLMMRDPGSLLLVFEAAGYEEEQAKELAKGFAEMMRESDLQ